MPHGYTPLPNPRTNARTQRDQEEEMAAAFDYSETEDDDQDASETQPLNSQSSPNNNPRDFTAPPLPQSSLPQPATPHSPGTYDFENVDYDCPPPGSPPRPSATALPNDHGNSNGLVPSFDAAQPPRRNWLQRTAAAVLPPNVAERIGLGTQIPSGPVGSGTSNDGVFANVTAKPTAPARIQEGDNTYLVPEDAGGDAPPSYASAQADAVPPYWETTVHAPFSPDSAGEMIIDSLPTGAVFSFLWNMLVSVSFQFVGFLLTYLLHTTHAARLGSRAGLGITLIQYGFALRGKIDAEGGEWDPNRPTFASGAEADAWYNEHAGMMNATSALGTSPIPDDQVDSFVASATTEWLSFFLMTVGWFILLTSVLGFWRVKRWERGILASQRESSTTPQSTSTARNVPMVSRIEQVFGIRGGSRGDLFRQGFGFRWLHLQEEDESTRAVISAEEGEAARVRDTHTTSPPGGPQHSSTAAHAPVLSREARLERALEEAGFL